MQNITRRLGQHASDVAKQIAEPFESWIAHFKFVGDGVEVRQAEQFVLDYVKEKLKISEGASLGKSANILNKRNEIKEFIGKLNICKD